MELTKSCLQCGKTIIKPQNESLKNWETRHKFCSRSCSAKFRKIGLETRFSKERGYIPPTAIKKGQHLSKDTQFKKDSTPWNKDRFTSNSYGAVHNWVRHRFGKPNKCQQCGKIGERFHWANVTGVYERKREHWKRMCPACHNEFDRGSPKWTCNKQT